MGSDQIWRYECMWERHEEFENFIATRWAESGDTFSVGQLGDKLGDLAEHLHFWDRMTFGNVWAQIKFGAMNACGRGMRSLKTLLLHGGRRVETLFRWAS